MLRNRFSLSFIRKRDKNSNIISFNNDATNLHADGSRSFKIKKMSSYLSFTVGAFSLLGCVLGGAAFIEDRFAKQDDQVKLEKKVEDSVQVFEEKIKEKESAISNKIDSTEKKLDIKINKNKSQLSILELKLILKDALDNMYFYRKMSREYPQSEDIRIKLDKAEKEVDILTKQLEQLEKKG